MDPQAGKDLKIGGLANPMPSLKFYSRGYTTIVTPANGEALIHCTPSIATDFDSCVCVAGTNLQSDPGNLTVAPAAAPARATLRLPTSFTRAQLNSDNAQWRLVSAEIVINNITASLNRQGVFYVLSDYEGNIPFIPATDTYTSVISSIVGNQRTGRYVVADLEKSRNGHLRIPLLNSNMDDWRSSQGLSYDGNMFPLSVLPSQDILVPITTYGSIAGTSIPNVYVFFTGAAQTLDVEMHANWEITFRGQEALYTTSASHPSASDDITAHMTHLINTKGGIFKGDTMAREGAKQPPPQLKHAGNAWMYTVQRKATNTVRKTKNTLKLISNTAAKSMRGLRKAKAAKNIFNGAKDISSLLKLATLMA